MFIFWIVGILSQNKTRTVWSYFWEFCTSCVKPCIIHPPFIYAHFRKPTKVSVRSRFQPFNLSDTLLWRQIPLFIFLLSGTNIFSFFFPPLLYQGQTWTPWKRRTHTSRAGRSPGPVILHLHFSHLADVLIRSDLQRVQRQTEPECSDVGGKHAIWVENLRFCTYLLCF